MCQCLSTSGRVAFYDGHSMAIPHSSYALRVWIWIRICLHRRLTWRPMGPLPHFDKSSLYILMSPSWSTIGNHLNYWQTSHFWVVSTPLWPSIKMAAIQIILSATDIAFTGATFEQFLSYQCNFWTKSGNHVFQKGTEFSFEYSKYHLWIWRVSASRQPVFTRHRIGKVDPKLRSGAILLSAPF